MVLYKVILLTYLLVILTVLVNLGPVYKRLNVPELKNLKFKYLGFRLLVFTA